ncbi:hypothetical protein Bca4012_071835 [Brassica carinata]
MSGLSTLLPRANRRERRPQTLDSPAPTASGNPLITTSTKNHISYPKVRPKSPHRQHEEESTTGDAVVRDSKNRRLLPPLHHPGTVTPV